jgi:hypothetical protein
MGVCVRVCGASTARPSLSPVVSIYEPPLCLARQPSLNLVITMGVFVCAVCECVWLLLHSQALAVFCLFTNRMSAWQGSLA